MKRTTYNKLIRDNIPEIIKNTGGISKISILSDEDYKRALHVKMAEEVKELTDAQNCDEILNELADIEEVVHAIAKNNGIPMKEVEKQRKEKVVKRGGFKKKLFLKYVDKETS